MIGLAPKPLVIRFFGGLIDVFLDWRFLDGDRGFAAILKDIVFTPFFILRKINGLVEGKDSMRDLAASCGFISSAILDRLEAGAPTVLVVASGVGEVLNSIPLAAEIRRSGPACNIVFMTYNTLDVEDIPGVRENGIILIPYPFDFRWTVAAWVRAFSPEIMLVLEDHFCFSLGPNLLEALKKKHRTRILVLNAFRTQEEPWSRMVRLRAKFYGKRLWAAADGVTVVSEPAREFHLRQGVAAERITVVPNLKFDTSIASVAAADLQELRKRFRIDRGDRTVVFGSLHHDEIPLFVDAYERLLGNPGRGGVKAIFAPRAKNCAALFDLLRRRGFDPAFASSLGSLEPRSDSRVTIIDTFGELRRIYALADIVVIGGSFLPHLRGHNPIEAAHHSKPIIIGPFAVNFRDAVDAFVEADAIVRASSGDDLSKLLASLLESDERRADLGAKARLVADRRRGALKTYVAMLETFLRERMEASPERTTRR